ncbi:MAG: hypothetical protein MJ007_00945 [Paludibacteraceae bacterium]|nr:hypothetical protein [Paludibacteraceae bacterium]
MKNLVKIKDTFFCGVRHCGKAMLLLVALTALSSAAWADDMNFFVDGAWDLQYYDGGDHWLSDGGGYKMGSTQELGVKSTLYIKGTWVKTWQNGTWVVNNVTFYYNVTGDSQHDYKITDFNDLGSGNRSWTIDNKIDYDLIGKAPNNPGQNTMAFHYVINEWGDRTSSTCYLNFTIPGFKKTTATGSFGDVNLGANKSETISFTQHYGTSLNTSNCKITGDGASSYSVTSISETGVTVKFQPTGGIGSKPATLTITDAHSKKCTITLSGNATSSTAPTVLISKSEQVNLQEVTLFGYVKYTGCKNINKVGFIISQTESEVTSGTAQVYEATTAPETIEAGSDFSLFSDEFENETYYYRAWMKASDNTVVLSDEVRTFEPQGVCNITGAASILPIFKSGNIEESATFADEHASIDLTVNKTCIADVYHWNVTESPASSTVTFSAQNKRNTSVTVNKVGQYKFTLTANCTGGTQYTSTTVLTLNVCAPAEFTQLYLDKHVNNVLCAEEEATATCITKENYTYALYGPDGEQIGVPLPGTGATQTWRHVEGAGVFTMRTSPTSMPYCAAVVSSATQSYNEPTLEIIADTDLANITNYQPVILSKKNVTSDTYVDTNPTWEIIAGSDKGYLLNEHNRLAYDNRAREKVVFKGGAATASQITVKASAYKTVEVTDAGGNYTKQCPTTVDVNLTVSPATEYCPD